MIVATRAAQQPGLLVRKHSARGEDLRWNEGLSKQHDKKHDINNKTYGFSSIFDNKQVLNQSYF
jgi:hypothetical protein